MAFRGYSQEKAFSSVNLNFNKLIERDEELRKSKQNRRDRGKALRDKFSTAYIDAVLMKHKTEYDDREEKKRLRDANLKRIQNTIQKNFDVKLKDAAQPDPTPLLEAIGPTLLKSATTLGLAAKQRIDADHQARVKAGSDFLISTGATTEDINNWEANAELLKTAGAEQEAYLRQQSEKFGREVKAGDILNVINRTGVDKILHWDTAADNYRYHIPQADIAVKALPFMNTATGKPHESGMTIGQALDSGSETYALQAGAQYESEFPDQFPGLRDLPAGVQGGKIYQLFRKNISDVYRQAQVRIDRQQEKNLESLVASQYQIKLSELPDNPGAVSSFLFTDSNSRTVALGSRTAALEEFHEAMENREISYDQLVQIGNDPDMTPAGNIASLGKNNRTFRLWQDAKNDAINRNSKILGGVTKQRENNSLQTFNQLSEAYHAMDPDGQAMFSQTLANNPEVSKVLTQNHLKELMALTTNGMGASTSDAFKPEVPSDFRTVSTPIVNEVASTVGSEVMKRQIPITELKKYTGYNDAIREVNKQAYRVYNLTQGTREVKLAAALTHIREDENVRQLLTPLQGKAGTDPVYQTALNTIAEQNEVNKINPRVHRAFKEGGLSAAVKVDLGQGTYDYIQDVADSSNPMNLINDVAQRAPAIAEIVRQGRGQHLTTQAAIKAIAKEKGIEFNLAPEHDLTPEEFKGLEKTIQNTISYSNSSQSTHIADTARAGEFIPNAATIRGIRSNYVGSDNVVDTGLKDYKGRSVKLSPEADRSFRAMIDAGMPYNPADVTSVYRDENEYLRLLKKKYPAAENSAHNFGEALDVHGNTGRWIKEYGSEFGWNRVAYGRGDHGGHIEFTGWKGAVPSTVPTTSLPSDVNLVDPYAADRVPGGVSSKGGGKDVVVEEESRSAGEVAAGIGDAVLNSLLPGNPFDLDKRGN